MRRLRVPKLVYSEHRGIGWHASYRDPASGIPRKQRFPQSTEAGAKVAYAAWLADYLKHRTNGYVVGHSRNEAPALHVQPQVNLHSSPPDSLLVVATQLIAYEESRIRSEGSLRRAGTISQEVCTDRTRQLRTFLAFLNQRHGQGWVGRSALAGVTMGDVEAFNQSTAATRSEAEVVKHMQAVRRLIERAGRPEHGFQRLGWNWESRNRYHGRATQPRVFPTLQEFQALLKASDARGQALIWLAVGCGFGQRDLSELRVRDIDATSYDLRRSKTGLERYGDTPAQVWAQVLAYKQANSPTDRMFTTRHGYPLLHGSTDAVHLWYVKLQAKLGLKLGGFYALRGLGATVYGSRPGVGLSAMRTFLGHSASSRMADAYLKPIRPEYRELIDWLRCRLA